MKKMLLFSCPHVVPYDVKLYVAFYFLTKWFTVYSNMSPFYIFKPHLSHFCSLIALNSVFELMCLKTGFGVCFSNHDLAHKNKIIVCIKFFVLIYAFLCARHVFYLFWFWFVFCFVYVCFVFILLFCFVKLNNQYNIH